MLSIQDTILCIVLSVSASFSLWEWMNEGMILEPYLRWLKKVSNYKLNGEHKATYKWYYKPLGGCIICMNVWISIVILFGCFIGLMPLYPLFAVVFISNLITIKWI